MPPVELERFARGQTELVVSTLLGGPVSRRTADEFHRASGGMAFILGHLVAGAAERNVLARIGDLWDLTAAELPLTPRLAETVEAQLADVGPSQRAALEQLAVCGPLRVEDLRIAVPACPVGELVDSGLATLSDGPGSRLVALACEVYRRVLRTGMPDRRRDALIAGQARRLKGRGPRDAEEMLRLASWQVGLGQAVEPRLLGAAAFTAYQHHAYEEAEALLDAVPSRERGPESLLLLADVLAAAGRDARLAELIGQRLSALTQEADVLTLAAAWTWSRLAGGREAPAVDIALRKRVTTAVGRRELRVLEGCRLIAAGRVRPGLALLEGPPLPAGPASRLAACLRPIGLALAGRTRAAVTLAAEAPHWAPLVFALTEAGDPERAVAAGDVSDGSRAGLWGAAFVARARLQAGQASAARRDYADVVAAAKAHGFSEIERLAWAGLAAAAAQSGAPDMAAQAWDQAAALNGPVVGGVQAGLGCLSEGCLGEAWLLAARGQATAARTLLAQGADACRTDGRLTEEAALLADVARLGDAASVAGRLAELADLCDSPGVAARAAFARELTSKVGRGLMSSAAESDSLGGRPPAGPLGADAATQPVRRRRARPGRSERIA